MQPALAVLGAVAVLAALLAVSAFTRPLVRTEVVEEAYVHQGAIDYSARVARNAVYPDGEVATGQPVFLRLVRRLRLDFHYRLDSPVPVSARGRIALDARLADGRGWSRTLPAGARAVVPRHGGCGRRNAGSAADPVSRGRSPGADRICPGRVLPHDPAPRERVGPPWRRADRRLLRPVRGLRRRRRPAPAEPRGRCRCRALRAARGGEHVTQCPDELSLGPADLAVGTARRVSLLGLVGSLILIALVAWPLLGRREDDEASRIAARYGALLVPVATRPPTGPCDRAGGLGGPGAARRASRADDPARWRTARPRATSSRKAGTCTATPSVSRCGRRWLLVAGRPRGHVRVGPMRLAKVCLVGCVLALVTISALAATNNVPATKAGRATASDRRERSEARRLRGAHPDDAQWSGTSARTRTS